MRYYLSMVRDQKFLSENIIMLPRIVKRLIAVISDTLLCILTVSVAYWLRLDAWVYPIGNQWLSYSLSLALAVPIFIHFGLYRAIFRYVGWHALTSVAWACTVYGLAYASLFTAFGFSNVPRTTGILQPILLFLAIGTSRALARLWLGDGYRAILKGGNRRRVLIYGAGSAGRQLEAGLSSSPELGVVGFLDDDRSMWGSYLNGKTVYPPEELPDLIESLEISDVLLAIPSASRKHKQEIVDRLRGHKVTVRTLPGMAELANGEVTTNDLRPLQIDDLLGRDPVPPDPALLGKYIAGQNILVTGAGGSIGSELCRQIVRQRPAQIILFEHGEYNLYAIEQELAALARAHKIAVDIVPWLASVTDATRVADAFRQHKPATVFHAAAYKHVPLVEANPTEGARNNVFGTRIVAQQAIKHGCANFVLVSTDKAVRPTNVMGATKRLAEMVLQSLAKSDPSTRFSMVRFGNVLGSSGSVVPLFRRQIASGGPVTLTHKDVTRYFMTIPEAAQLVIQAGAMAEGGDVFVLDMGEPIRIYDLAVRMIELSGLNVKSPDGLSGDIAISVTGLRPGEKLYEELLIGNSPSPTLHSLIMKATEPAVPCAELELELHQLEQAIEANVASSVIEVLSRIVPEFQHASHGQMQPVKAQGIRLAPVL
ncbi:COG1086 Predicted nucleoside-diphosphate sugar epimerases [Sphingomonadaceae bacterium]